MTENFSKLDVCSEISEDLSAFIDGELSKDHLSRVYEHLLECKACREAYEDLKITQKSLQNYFKRSTERFEIPEIFPQKTVVQKIIFIQRRKNLVYSAAVIILLAAVSYFSINLTGINAPIRDKNNIQKVNFTKEKKNFLKLNEFLHLLPLPSFKRN